MFVLYNKDTQQIAPYPRNDDKPVQNLDPAYIALEVVQQDRVQIDPAVQDLVGTETLDLDNLKLVRGWEVITKPRDPLYDIFSPDPE